MYRKNINTLRTEFSTVSCSLFPRCSGCKHLDSLHYPPIWKEMLSFFEKRNLGSIELVLREVSHWRSKVKLAVRKGETPLIGLFQGGTHQVVDMKECPMHVPCINEAMSEIRKQIEGIEPYDETRGRLKYIQMHAERSSQKVQLALVWNGGPLSSLETDFVQRLYNSWDHWHSIWMNEQPLQNNQIFGPNWKRLFGQEDLWQEISGMQVCYHPACFAQAHLPVFEAMLDYLL